VQRLFKTHIRRGDVVYDLGANVGFFTLLAAKLVGASGQVNAFEPLPRNLIRLRRHLQLNRVTNVTVFPLAIARTAGVAQFNIAESPSMGSLQERGTLEVQTASLDDLVRSGAIAPPSLMKIDVEGGEHDLLTGAAETLSKYRPTILLSTHGYQQHELCWSLLSTAGYTLELIRDGEADGDYLVLARR
jgi:FkbM family methyltransferase